MKLLILGSTTLALALAGTAMVSNSALAQDIDPQMKPLPGQYESDIQLISMNVAGMPPNMIDMMRGVFEKKTTICLTPEEVEEGYKQALKKSQDGDCQYERFDASGGKIDAEMICKGPNGPMTMQMSGTGTPTSSDVTMEMSGDMGTGPGSMKMRVIQKRIGDC